MNFLKGLGYILPTILIITGVVVFCVYDPMTVEIFKIIFRVFCGALSVIIIFFGVLLVIWSLKSTFLHVFKININLKSKKPQ